MEEAFDRAGHGTLSDVEDIELAPVEYRLRTRPADDLGSDVWGGELQLPDPTMTVVPGRYVLTLDDGTRVDIDVEPLGSVDGDATHVEFTGVGAFGRRVEEG